MIERIVERILLSKFENIFYGIAHKNIHVGILSGHFTIENIGLQPTVFNYLNLPIMLKYSFVEKLSVSYPWRESNTNLVINIENIYAILTPKAEQDFNFMEMLWKNKEEMIKAAIKEFLSKEKEAQKKTRERTGFENTLFRLLDNIEIRIKHIHIRFEHVPHGYSFGLTIHEILAETRDPLGNKYYFDREKSQEKHVNQVLEINRIGFYWNSTEGHMLSTLPIAEITNQMYNLSVSHLFMDDLLPEPVNFSRHNEPRLRYLININMSCSMKKYLAVDDYQYPEYSCEVNFHEIECKVTHDQYSQIIQLVQSFLAYQAQWKTIQQMAELQNYKLKSGREILNMMRAKRYTHQGDESQYTSKYVQSYLSWVFRSVRERYIMRKFIVLVMRKPITFDNIMKSPPLRRIIGKTEGERIKQWLFIAMRFKIDYEHQIAKINIDKEQYFNSKLQATLAQAYKGNQKERKIASLSQIPDPSADASATDEHHYIWFKLRVNITSGKFEISKGEFGLELGCTGLHAELNLRKVNFFTEIAMNDFFVKLFDHWGSGGRAYVDVVKKTTTFEFGEQPRLLAIRFEKNPIAKPFVFTETEFELRSIELTAFPSSLKKLYEILSEGVTKKTSEKQQKPPQNLKTDRDNYGQNAIKTFGFQTNSISAKIHSPWIIIPFSKVNDRKSECWVVRLGDFSVRPPLDLDIFEPKENDEEEELYYDSYEMSLDNFELKYFSSIYYFYSSMKFGASQKMAHLLNSPLMEQGSSLHVIKPFSCQLKIKILKKYLSQSIKESHHELKSSLEIGSIQIHLSSLVLSKLKMLLEQFNKDDNPQFLQHSKQDILQGATLKGVLSVHYKDFQNMRFYGVMAGCQLYLFATEHSDNHQLQLNLQQLQVRLIDIEHLASRKILNPDSKDVLELYFESGAEMSKWSKHIEKSYEVKLKSVKPKQSKPSGQSVLPETKSKQQIEQPLKKQSKYKLGMSVRSLELILYDQQKEFLSCLITNMTFHLVQNIHRGMDLSVEHIHLSENSHKLKVLLSSDLMQASTSRSNPPARRFLDMTLLYDEFGAIREVNFKFQDILLVFKVDVIQKIMSFFFLENQNANVPAPANPKKMVIDIALEIDNLHLVCVLQEHIAGIIKSERMKFIYKSTGTQESYTFTTRKLEAANYENSDISKEFTLFKSREGRQQLFELTYMAGKILEPESPLKNGGRRSESRVSNSGMDIVSPMLNLTISGYQLSYQHEPFMRIFNYAINKFIGALSSKFKVKKEYTDDYVFETWKTRTTAVLKIQVKDCILKIRDTPESEEYLRAEIPYAIIHRNYKENFEPELGTVNSKKGPMRLLYEKIVIEPRNLDIYYIHEGRHERVKVNNNRPLNLVLQYNRWNLPKDYYPVLRSIDDIDRTITLIVEVLDPLDLNLQKIVFYMILKMYYRNIKQKDGLAEVFEPASSFPTPREYKIRVPDVIVRLSEEVDLMFKQFAVMRLPNFRLDAREVRTLINFTIKSDSLLCKYEDSISSDTVIQPYRPEIPPVFKVEMQSDRGTISSDITLKNYRAHLDINQIDALVDYFDFDANDVENKKMPKKSTKSFQNFRITFRDGLACLMTNEDVISISGLVFVNLSKNPGSDWDTELKSFLGEEVQPADVNEKELKVNAENVSVFLNSVKLTEVPNFLYTRNEFSARKVIRRHRRQHILLQHFQLCCFANIVSKLQKLYKQRIKKVKVKKSYFDPAAGIPPKRKYNEKRILTIEGEPVSVVLLHQFQEQTYPAVKLLVDLRKLVILMMTSVVKQVSTIFDLKVFNCGDNFDFDRILDAKNMVLTFDSDEGRKKILILENVLNFDTYNVNESIINRLLHSRSELLKPTLTTRSPVCLVNDTDTPLGVELTVSNKTILNETLTKYQTKNLDISHYSLCRLFGPSAKIRVALIEEMVEANIQLAMVDVRKLINLENRYYVGLKMDGGKLVLRMMSQFKLENRTGLRLRYRLKDPKGAKIMAVIEPKANASLKFGKGTQLIIYDELAQEDTLITYGDGFEKRTNFNFRLRLSATSMSTLTLSSKILLTNMLPTKLLLSHHKFSLQLGVFETAEVLESAFRMKKQVTMTIGEEKFKCPTELFLMQSNQVGNSLLELTNSEGRLAYCLEFQREFKDDSTHWILKPQIVLLNLTGDMLHFSRSQQEPVCSLLPNTSTFCNKSDTLLFHKPFQFKLHLGSLKPGEEAVKDLILSYSTLEQNSTKLPSVILQSQVTLLNDTKYPLLFGNSNLPLQPYSECPAAGQGNQIRIGMGIEEKVVSFEKAKEVYLFLKRKVIGSPDLQMVLLKAEMVAVQKRKLIKITEEGNPSRYWIKNNAKGFTLTARQFFEGASQQFIIPEGSERGISLEDPMAPDTFQIEFYYNLKNIEFNKRAILNPSTLPELTFIEFDEQGVSFKFKMTFSRGSTSYTLTVDPIEGNAVEPETSFEVDMKRMLFNLRFSEKQSSHRNLCVQILQLYFKLVKSPPLTTYSLFLEDLSAQYKRSLVLSRIAPQPLLDLTLCMDKSRTVTKIQKAHIALSSIAINIHEQFLLETATFLKKFDLLSDKKKAFKTQRRKCVLELIKTGGGLDSLHELEMAQGRKDRPKEDKPIVVNLFKLKGCTVNVSYLKGETFNVNEFRTHNILKYLAVIPNIKEMKIQLNDLSIEKFDGTQKTFKKKLTSHIKKTIPTTVSSSISSLSVFENPVEAISTITSVVNGIWNIT